MADPTTNWTPEALQSHIQDAIDLELWTIPLYLCAMCSIKDQTSEPAQLIMSVAVQEMLHLELACNLANAFGWTPQFNQPVYTPQTGIPFHTPEAPINGPYEVKLGPLDENAINLFLEVELPKDLSADKGHGTLDPAPTYDSIGEFYQALRAGVTQLWDTCYQPSSTDMQKTVFAQTNPPQTGNYPNLDIYVDSLADAMQAIDTIVDQGEGADAQGDIPTEFQPTGEPLDSLSHYMRFLKVKGELPIDTYTDNGSPATQQQDALNQAFTTLLQNLGTSFSETGTDLDSDAWTAMFSINTLAAAVWQAGACPEFRVLSS
jgi:hypothetical protein